VVKTQATKGEGVAELAAHIDRCFADHADGSVAARQRDRARMRFRVGEILRDMLDRRMRSDDGQWLDGLLDPVIARESDPYALAEQMLERAGG
jgi:putative protein kinase ArgK-like GTPase of G3E family